MQWYNAWVHDVADKNVPKVGNAMHALQSGPALQIVGP